MAHLEAWGANVLGSLPLSGSDASGEGSGGGASTGINSTPNNSLVHFTIGGHGAQGNVFISISRVKPALASKSLLDSICC